MTLKNERIKQLTAERNELQALLVAMVIRAGGEATIGNATMTAACNGVGLHLSQNDDGELHISTFIADEQDAS